MFINHTEHIIIITLILLCFSSNLFGQQVEGIITDSDEPLIGATVVIKNTTQGTTSDVDGSFKLENVSASDTLVVNYLGYETLEVLVNGQSYIEINLSSKISELEEVIVVGYGRQKKRHIAGAIARVNSEDIENLPILRAEQALQGQSAGVQVTTQSGQPGDEPTVRIRGIGTTKNAKPIYVVDGMQVGNMDYLNPSDIETIDVLKDAATAAIYGSQSANGVVLVTTKKGKTGKMQLEYNTYYGFQNSTKKLDLLDADEYKMMMNEGARNAGLTEPFDLLEISTHNTDWQEAIFEKNAPILNHSIGIMGGNEKSTFASSFSYFSQQGIIGGNKSRFDRYTARLNSKHQVNKWLNFGNNLGYTNLTKRGIGTNTSFNGIFNSALSLDPLTPIFETDEDVLTQYPYNTEQVVKDTSGSVYGISNYVGAEVVNPLALLEIDKDETRKDELVGNLYAELEPIKGLKLKTSLGVDLAYVLDDGYTPLYYLNGAQLNDNKSTVFKKIDRYFTWLWDNTIFYEQQINQHNFSVMLGSSAREDKFENIFGSNAKVRILDSGETNLNLAEDTVWVAKGEASHGALFSLFSRLTYNYDDRISLTGIIRRDGSSNFGANQRYGIFPSIGLAWVLSEEAFMPNLGPVNYLKLRASFGINGNQDIDRYQYVPVLDMTTRFYTFDNNPAVGTSPSYIENQDIAWEQAFQFSVGTDVGLFENKMDITLDYYIEETRNLLEKIRIPTHVGNEGPFANVGTVRNKGFEAGINWRNKTKNFKYNVGINASYNKNEMIKIGDVSGVILGAQFINSTATRAIEGLPIAYFWGYQTDGIFQNKNDIFSHINNEGEVLQPNALPGDVRFVDFNGDGSINEMDRTYLGNPTPDVTTGFMGSINYKNIECSVFVQGSFGHQVFNGIHRKDLRFTNHTTQLLNRWTGEGTSNTQPQYSWADNNNNHRISDLYIENASFVRLKNLQLGYTVPTNLAQKVKLQKVRFYVSGENLVTLSNYAGIDPEIGAFGSFDIGIDRGVYPQAKTLRVGAEIVF